MILFKLPLMYESPNPLQAQNNHRIEQMTNGITRAALKTANISSYMKSKAAYNSSTWGYFDDVTPHSRPVLICEVSDRSAWERFVPLPRAPLNYYPVALRFSVAFDNRYVLTYWEYGVNSKRVSFFDCELSKFSHRWRYFTNIDQWQAQRNL